MLGALTAPAGPRTQQTVWILWRFRTLLWLGHKLWEKLGYTSRHQWPGKLIHDLGSQDLSRVYICNAFLICVMKRCCIFLGTRTQAHIGKTLYFFEKKKWPKYKRNLLIYDRDLQTFFSQTPCKFSGFSKLLNATFLPYIRNSPKYVQTRSHTSMDLVWISLEMNWSTTS